MSSDEVTNKKSRTKLGSTKKTNGEGSLTVSTRNGKPYYTGKVTIGFDQNGKQIRKTFGSFKKTIVIEKMNKAKNEHRENTSFSEFTFEKLFFYWIDNFKKIEVNLKTYYKYVTCFKKRIADYPLAQKKASRIELIDLQNHFTQLAKDEWSIYAIKETYMYINSCLEFGVIQDIVHKNYCKGVTLQKSIRKKVIKAFTIEEEKSIIEELNIENIVDSAIFFTFHTGLRLGEVLGLKWKDIDGNIAHIKRQLGRVKYDTGIGQELRDLKTNGSRRDVPLPNKALDVLNKIDKNFELIFSENEKGMDHKKLQRRLKSICNKLDIKDKSFHSIRHTYATRLFEMGVPIKTVQSLLGHSDIATTMNVYTHVMKEKKLEVLDLLNTR